MRDMREKFRRWLRGVLGLNAMAGMIHTAEKKAVERHVEFMQAVQTILNNQCLNGVVLDRIEKMMIAGHIQEPRQFTPPVLDWDTVQAIALAALEKEQH